MKQPTLVPAIFTLWCDGALLLMCLSLGACDAELTPLFDKDNDKVISARDCNDMDPNIGSSFRDQDGDGYGDGDPLAGCNKPPDSGYASEDGDCDDNAASVYPGAEEICNEIDEDCDGDVLEDFDADGDGFMGCESGEGVYDCDDQNPDINPDALEVCDGVNNDCQNGVDDGLRSTFYSDRDKDGYGDVSASVEACEPPEGYVADSSDCDDTDPAINPAATEVCDDKDNDCDGGENDKTPGAWYPDSDGDEYGDSSAMAVQSCGALEGHSTITIPPSSNSTLEPGLYLMDEDGLPVGARLGLDSPLIDAGDPAFYDEDGTLADMGVYGGPHGNALDLDNDGAPNYFWPGAYSDAPDPDLLLHYDCNDLDAMVQSCSSTDD